LAQVTDLLCWGEIFKLGFVAKAITTFYKNLPGFNIIIASNETESAREMEAMNPKAFKAVLVDVMRPETYEAYVKQCDIAISLVPAVLHMKICNICLKNSKNLVTSSYVSPDMQKLDSEVRAKGLTFLNECGLDPGIDHLATMLTIGNFLQLKQQNISKPAAGS
jgi:saccharopine dehydrogenase-like NADP-dependent oxidoreductase